MGGFFHRIRLGWDDLDFEAKFELLIWVAITVVVVVVGHAAVRHLDDPDPKPPGKIIHLQPY